MQEITQKKFHPPSFLILFLLMMAFIGLLGFVAAGILFLWFLATILNLG